MPSVKVLTEDYNPEKEAKHTGETRFLAEAFRQGAEGIVAYERCQATAERQLAGGGVWIPELKREVELER